MTKPPAMPELPEPFALSLSIHDGENCKWPLLECKLLQKHPAEKQHLYTADQMRAYALAALQSAQPAAAVSDEVISRLWSWSATAEAERTATTQQHAFAYELLALRPQAVPMTREEKLAAWKAATIELPSPENCYLRGLVDAEAHHGITQRADGGED